jgi:hypothetical protein
MKDWSEITPLQKTPIDDDAPNLDKNEPSQKYGSSSPASERKRRISFVNEGEEATKKVGSVNPPSQFEATIERKWRRREDKLLKKAVQKYKDEGFTRIAKEIEGRSKNEWKRRYQELREINKRRKIWASNEENVIKRWLGEDDKTRGPIDILANKLPLKSIHSIKEKVHQLRNSRDRKKVVIRNQRNEKPKVVKAKIPKRMKSKAKKCKKSHNKAALEEVKKEVETEQKGTLTYFPNQGTPALFDEKKLNDKIEPALPRPNSTEVGEKRIIELGNSSTLIHLSSCINDSWSIAYLIGILEGEKTTKRADSEEKKYPKLNSVFWNNISNQGVQTNLNIYSSVKDIKLPILSNVIDDKQIQLSSLHSNQSLHKINHSGNDELMLRSR